MTLLKNYIILILTVLLIYSTSWCQSNYDNNFYDNDVSFYICDSISCYSDTIIKHCDSVIVSVDALRIANTKMIELKYQKEINANLQEVIRVDSMLISSFESNLFAIKKQAKEEIDNMKKQRNKAIVIGSASSSILLILLIAAL